MVLLVAVAARSFKLGVESDDGVEVSGLGGFVRRSPHIHQVLDAPLVVSVIGSLNRTGDQGSFSNVDLQNKLNVFSDTISK